MHYMPSDTHIERYADLLINYALGNDQGINPGDTVSVVCPENARPMYVELCRAIWRAGGNVIGEYQPANQPGSAIQRIFYELASDAQLEYSAERYHRGLLEEVDHFVAVISETDPHALRAVDPAKMMRRQAARLR